MNLKLEKLLTAGFVAALGASFLASNPADARNGWMKADCNSKGDCNYHKVTSRDYPFVEYKTNGQHFNSTSMAETASSGESKQQVLEERLTKKTGRK